MPGTKSNAPANRPALNLLPGGKSRSSASDRMAAARTRRSAPRRTPVSSLPGKPRMAAKLRLIAERIGVDPDTPSGSASALRYLRNRQLSAARSVTRPKRTPLTNRDEPMNVTFWEVFGRFGRKATNALNTLLRRTRKRLQPELATPLPESTIPAAAVHILQPGILRRRAA